MDMFLRIAPELYLKRLLVGGFERVFEFTTNFRNEGVDKEHNPELSVVDRRKVAGGEESALFFVFTQHPTVMG